MHGNRWSAPTAVLGADVLVYPSVLADDKSRRHQKKDRVSILLKAPRQFIFGGPCHFSSFSVLGTCFPLRTETSEYFFVSIIISLIL